jgi:hypothetical protein
VYLPLLPPSEEASKMTDPELAEKIMARLVRSGGCLEWPGRRNKDGYGIIYTPVRNGRRVHRVLWDAAIGPIPDGYQVDHLCFNKPCANLWHLEPVTPLVNSRRAIDRTTAANYWLNRTVCENGHEYTPENTYLREPGTRICRTCRRDAKRRDREAARGGGPAVPVRLYDDRNGKTKLTVEQVAEIRRRRSEGETCAAIAADFGIHHAHVSRIARFLSRHPRRSNG